MTYEWHPTTTTNRICGICGRIYTRTAGTTTDPVPNCPVCTVRLSEPGATQPPSIKQRIANIRARYAGYTKEEDR